jgi:hypothetical protein
MKYAVITAGLQRPPQVQFTSRFRIVAHAVAVAIQRIEGFAVRVVEVDLRTQVLINVCEQREIAAERLQMAVEALAHLVCRDDSGKWTTVHEADVEVPYQAELDALLA